MARGFSRITIVGNLGADPEMRYLPGGDPVTTFTVAVNRKRKDESETDWYRVACYRKQAEIADQYLRKGSQVLVDGQLSIREYTASDGIERTSVEINCDQFQMLGSKGDDAGPREQEADSDLPF